MTIEVLILSGAAASVVGYLVGWFGHGEHRKGCNECDADLRRRAEAQQAANHDYEHKVLGRNCPDAKCDRNRPAND